jgi:hypothetical protein
MSNASLKWGLGLVLLAMLVDTVLPHPRLEEARNEYQFKGMVPAVNVHGFASERQWLFAHRKFRNQCVLEAMVSENEQPSAENQRLVENREFFAHLHHGISFADLRAPN